MKALAGEGLLEGETMMVVVAHADDETIGLGAQLPRMPGIVLVHATDGAPRDGIDAAAKGFSDREAYARARRVELARAMTLAGLPETALFSLGFADQEGARHLAEGARRLTSLFRERGCRTVFTHAYEGGHPDHDAVAYMVHRAARRLGPHAPVIVEMPFYYATSDGWVTQSFLDNGPPALTVWLDAESWAFKADLCACHASQRDVLRLFALEAERFRPSPDYDFAARPHAGPLLYERESWGLDWAGWQEAVAKADAALEAVT